MLLLDSLVQKMAASTDCKRLPAPADSLEKKTGMQTSIAENVVKMKRFFAAPALESAAPERAAQ